MAQSTSRSRRKPAPRSLRDVIRSGPDSTLEALAFVSVGLAAGLGLGLSSGARAWAYEALGYGWVPTAIWVAVTLAAVRYHRRSVRAYWRWWVLAAAAATISIGALSLFHVGDGVWDETGLGGRWGAVVGGAPAAVALGKMAAVALLTTLLLFPRPVGGAYLRILRYTVMGLQFTPVYVYMGLYRTYYFLEQRTRTLINSHLRRQGMEKIRLFLAQHIPAKLRARFAHDGASIAPPTAVLDTGEELSLWSDSDPGAIPRWSLDEAITPEETPLEDTDVTARGDKPSGWQMPSIKMLSPTEPHSNPDGPLEQMARHVERSLSDHGVAVEVKDIKAGPRIVRFGLVPGWNAKRNDLTIAEDGKGKGERSRVKVQSILMREKDLALALQTPYLRIEAPVPGEALVGLEVPSPAPTKVHLRGVMETPTFGLLAAKKGLPVALGEDTGGAPVVMDLTDLPHMLIAGATGSGKSVCINSIIASLLLTKSPDQLRMLMVDPKRVELTPFNGIPHLIMPVIVDVEEVNLALRGLMREMLRRYKRMEEVGARNITSYNGRVAERLPYLLLIVDELADLMLAGGFEVEQNLVRLAQLGRATGIHLVLATQRPSVNVVTGLLKANVPARAAFAVASQVDSRVILDSIGAEKLLGRGDMLLLHNESPKPRRVQGTLVYDEEIDRLVEHWTSQAGPPLPVIPMGDAGENGVDAADEQLMDQARDMALRNPNLSQSFLERRLKVGGWRSTQIMKLLEDEGLLAAR